MINCKKTIFASETNRSDETGIRDDLSTLTHIYIQVLVESNVTLNALDIDFFELVVSDMTSGLIEDKAVEEGTDENEDLEHKRVPIVDGKDGHNGDDEAVSHNNSNVGLLYANYAEDCDQNH